MILRHPGINRDSFILPLPGIVHLAPAPGSCYFRRQLFANAAIASSRVPP